MQENNLKVMHIIHNLRRAGAQEVVRILSEYLVKDGCVPIVCTFIDGPIGRDLEKLGIQVEVLRPRRYSILALPWFIIDLIHIRQELVQLVKKHEIDIIQTHILEMFDFLVLTLKFSTDLKIVLWTVHNVDFLPTEKNWLLKPKRVVYRLLYRLMAQGVSKFIAVSDEVREAVISQIGIIQDKVITIANGVDVKRYECIDDGTLLRQHLALESDSRLITVVGRLTTQKGHCYLITAAADVLFHHPNVHFLFVGEGKLKESLQAQAQTLGVSEHIHFLGMRHDVPNILAASEIFVLPSLWEGLSIALIEAMAASKPIVATSVSGTNEVMENNKTGLIVSPGDSQALAEAIIEMLNNSEQAQAMGKAAKEHVVTHYSAQKQADEHMALYRRSLSQS